MIEIYLTKGKGDIIQNGKRTNYKVGSIIIIGSVVKFLVALAGLLLIFWFLLTGLIKRDKHKIEKAGTTLVMVVALLLLFALIEFAFKARATF